MNHELFFINWFLNFGKARRRRATDPDLTRPRTSTRKGMAQGFGRQEQIFGEPVRALMGLVLDRGN